MKFVTQNNKYSIFNLANNDMRICIHKLFGIGDELFLNCFSLNIKDLDLGTEDFHEAVKKAKEIISKEINHLVSESNKFINDDSEIEISKW